MLQEDSNGETTFEIIDKKMEELSTAGEKTGNVLYTSCQFVNIAFVLVL